MDTIYDKMCQLLKETPLFFNVSKFLEYFASNSKWGLPKSSFSAF